MYLVVVVNKINFNKILIIILAELCIILTKIIEIFKKYIRKLPYKKREKFLVIFFLNKRTFIGNKYKIKKVSCQSCLKNLYFSFITENCSEQGDQSLSFLQMSPSITHMHKQLQQNFTCFCVFHACKLYIFHTP